MKRYIVLISLVFLIAVISGCATDGNYSNENNGADTNETAQDGKCSPNNDIVCTMEYNPVCCNGKTYSNSCVARANCATDCVAGECS
ncbi:TPA: hypothetical protein HA239_05210 [Candidatus Woesearchaeota archaeon]|nr:hypothetical protein QT06_C0001G0299 [archaeon GW2011_AR15]MBS3103618.1 hypothetical protein [Candidatus Woesearchaeota archaeon]HIH41782.1 hypothetical protein [Candidatus Woesearchaeota archaeon]